MAEGDLPGLRVPQRGLRSTWLDFEHEQRERPALYAGFEGPGLVTVLDALQQAVIDAYSADSRARDLVIRAFAGYREGAARMPQYAARFANVIDESRQADSQFTSHDIGILLKSLASMGLAATGHPAAFLGLSAGQLAASAQAAGQLSEATARAVTGRKANDISLQEYDLVTDPGRELPRRVATALRHVTYSSPLVIFIDTGETLGGTAWTWLRRVMTMTGSRLIWVVGARFETEADAGVDSPVAQFVRDIGTAHLVLMTPTRFDGETISEYLTALIPGCSYSPQQIDQIARFTRGLPLAIGLTAELLELGQQVGDACKPVQQGFPSTIISAVTRRYLVHAEQQVYLPDDIRRLDLMKIFGLAIAYGDLRADPALLAALWDVTDSLSAFRDLSSRHDFVLDSSRRLHDEVRDTLRMDLLDPYRRIMIRDLNLRAQRLYSERLAAMRSKWPTLDEQMEHHEYMAALLAALWHTLWLDNQSGLDMFIQLLPVLAVAEPAAADAAAAIADHFAATFNGDQLQQLDLITTSSRHMGPK